MEGCLIMFYILGLLFNLLPIELNAILVSLIFYDVFVLNVRKSFLVSSFVERISEQTVNNVSFLSFNLPHFYGH